MSVIGCENSKEKRERDLKEENNESLKCFRRWDSLIERYESVYVTLPSAESNAEHVGDEWHVSGLTYS